MELEAEPIERITPGAVSDVVDIQTSTGTFLACGVATHNCYARPTHARNSFELLSRALELLKKRMGNDVRIVTAGADWSKLFALAGIAPVTPVKPEWRAPVDSDEKHTWLDAHGDRIEVAAFHGRPVWFSTGLTSPSNAR